VPPAVASLPFLGDLVKQAHTRAQWVQELFEQNARLIGQLPATVKTLNDSLETFNQSVQRLDRAVNTIERATNQLKAPLEAVAPKLDRVAAALEVPSIRDIPELLDTLRREALPALRAATDTQRQIDLLASTVDRVIAVIAELPGGGIVRRFAGGGAEPPASE
jgi:methyl-accepting chemotaxis protein